jgi:signal transduction histidine kinase
MDSTAQLAHDLRNLATAIDGRCQLLERRLDRRPVALEDLVRLRELARRIVIRLAELSPTPVVVDDAIGALSRGERPQSSVVIG